MLQSRTTILRAASRQHSGVRGSCRSLHLHAVQFCYRAADVAVRSLRAWSQIRSRMSENGGRRRSGGAWTNEDSAELYQVAAWGKGYFAINEAGHVVVQPDTTPARQIDLYEVVQGLKARDLTTPVVVRFSDILAHRLRHLHGAFAQAIAENDYRNRYAAVYPIKVNQQRLVVEEVFRYGKEFGFGLEVGSKPELLAVMAMTENSPDRLIVCNGFKDDSYIEAVILATKLGRTIIPVVENFSELNLILKHADLTTVCGRGSGCASSSRPRAPVNGAIRRERNRSSGCSSPRSSRW